jgi:ribosome-binding protein aMBF1 (putative translation factor)
MEKSEFNIAFGQFIKNKRQVLNWSQIDLASKIGNNPQNISRIERGEINPTIFWTTKLAQVFNCLTSELIKEFEDFVKDQQRI